MGEGWKCNLCANLGHCWRFYFAFGYGRLWSVSWASGGSPKSSRSAFRRKNGSRSLRIRSGSISPRLIFSSNIAPSKIFRRVAHTMERVIELAKTAQGRAALDMAAGNNLFERREPEREEPRGYERDDDLEMGR